MPIPDFEPSGLLPLGLLIRARHPGAVGNWRVRATLKARGNILGVRVDPVTRERQTSVGERPICAWRRIA